MKIAWTQLTAADLNHLYSYLAAERTSSAVQVIKHIDEAVKALGAYPSLGRVGRVEGTRELIISNTPFIVVYRINPKRIEIISVIHMSRKWPESL